MRKLAVTAVCLLMALLLCACGSSGKWQEQYDLGVRYRNDGSGEEAVAAFTEAIALDPERAEGYLGRADAYAALAEKREGGAQRDAFRSAAEDYVRAMELGESEADYGEKAADAFFRAGAYEKAAPYYERIFETSGDSFGLEQVSRATGDEEYLQALCEGWPEAALHSYGELLGADGSQAFALADLDRDGTPELICGEADSESGADSPALLSYTLYTWLDGGTAMLYSGFVDTWMNPTIYVSEDGAVVNEGHGTSSGYELQYVRWPGPGHAAVSRDLYSYVSGYDDGGNEILTYCVDGAEVTESEFEDSLAACTQGLTPLVFYRNTAENMQRLLRTEDGGPTGGELLAAVKESVWWLNECAQETFGVEIDESGWFSDGEPLFRDCIPVTNFSSVEDVRAEASHYVAAEYLAGLEDNVEMIDGRLCLVRGARGYGAIGYDLDSLTLVENQGDTCIAACDRYYFDMYDCRAELRLERIDGDWRVTGVSCQGAEIAFDSPID